MSSPGPRVVGLPDSGIWRVGWATSPLHAPPPRALDLADTDAGNRFDAIGADFETSYYGTNPSACFAETLAHRRPKPALLDLIADGDEWKYFMAPGKIEAEWRRKRLLTRVILEEADQRFLDLQNHRTLAWINREFRAVLLLADLDEITVDTITKGDRKVTRYIASWIYKFRDSSGEPLFAGLRYSSRHGGDLECWAVFDRTRIKPVETRTIRSDDPDLRRIAELFGLTVY